MTEVALGFSIHTGWAAVVAVAGPAPSPRVVERRRLTLAERTERFVYHAAAELPAAAAGRAIEAARETALALAHRGLALLLADLGASGHRAVASGLPLGVGRPLPPLPEILRSHPLLHTAEGELYRQAVAEASAASGLTLTSVGRKELEASAARSMGVRVDALRRRLAEMGKPIGPPWARDQKDAALLALLALASAPRWSR